MVSIAKKKKKERWN